jgi:hypothetical protein
MVGNWLTLRKFSEKLSATSRRSSTATCSPAASVLEKFKMMDTKGQAAKSGAVGDDSAVHQNAVRSMGDDSRQLHVLQAKGEKVVQFSSAGLDGTISIWDVV